MARFPVGDADPERVRRLAAFVNAGDWGERRRIAEGDDDLAAPPTRRVLDGWVRAVAADGALDTAEDLRRYAHILELVHEHGVSATFETVAESAARTGDEALQRAAGSATSAESLAAVEEALTSYATALAATALPRGSAWWAGLGSAYSQRHDLAGDPEDLQLAVELTRRALADAGPEAAGASAGWLVNLATYLLDRHDAGFGDPGDLAEAGDVSRRAVDAAGAAGEHVAPAWLVRARAARAGFDQAREPALLADAVTAAGAAVAAADTALDRAAAAGTLGGALLTRYDAAGEPADLDAAITQHGRAVELAAPASAVQLSNLGIALLTRYDRLGNLGDLDRAVDVLQEASESTRETAYAAGAVATNLGLVLVERYERRRSGADLDRAVAVFREALERTPARSVQRPWVLLNLGGGLVDAYELHRRPADLDDAASALTEGLALVPSDSPDSAAFHNRLGAVLLHRAELTGPADLDTTDLDAAVAAARRAVEVTAPDSPRMPGWVESLATALLARWTGAPTEPGRRELSDVFRRAVELGERLDPAVAMRAALTWQEWALAAGPAAVADAVDATRAAVAALRTLVSTQLRRADKETWLRDTEGLVGRSALAHARAGDGRAAVLAAETCRAVLLDEGIRSGMDGVARLRAGGLAQRLETS